MIGELTGRSASGPPAIVSEEAQSQNAPLPGGGST